MDMASAQLRRPLVRVLLSARARVAAPVRRCYATGAVPVPASGATAHKAAPPTASPVWHTPCRPLQNAMLHGSAASPALLASQQPRSTRAFSRSAPRQQQTRTVDFLLADVGEGITECEIVEWCVSRARAGRLKKLKEEVGPRETVVEALMLPSPCSSFLSPGMSHQGLMLRSLTCLFCCKQTKRL